MLVVARPEEIVVGDVERVALHPPLEFLHGYLPVFRIGLIIGDREIAVVIELGDPVDFQVPHNCRELPDAVDYVRIQFDHGKIGCLEIVAVVGYRNDQFLCGRRECAVVFVVHARLLLLGPALR